MKGEQLLQVSLVEGLRLCLPSGFIVHHCANKPRSAIAGAIEKRMGAIAGWPDLEIIGRDGNDRPHHWYVEVKLPGQYAPAHQRDIHDAIRDVGYPVGIVKSWADVQRLASEWNLPWREAGQGRGA
jgi:hypothetical protein